jgi:predicted SAM-dependent methyltransferase
MKIEIGGGNSPVEGYEQIESMWGYEYLPFNDCTVESVYAAHVIEHIPWWLSQQAINDAYRILMPGGCLEVHTVNFEYLVDCYIEDRAADHWMARGKNPDLHPFKSIASRIFSVDEEPGGLNWHRSIYDMAWLIELFTTAGFHDLTYPHEPRGPQKHGPINIGIRGVK